MRWYHAVEHVGRTGVVVYHRFSQRSRYEAFLERGIKSDGRRTRFACVGPPDPLLVKAVGWSHDGDTHHSIRETPLLGRMIRAFKKENHE